MPTINQLSATTSLTTSDKMVVYSNDNGDSRKATLATLISFLHDNFQEPGLITQIVVPTASPQTVTLNASTQNIWLVLNPAATFGQVTVAMPPSATAFDGQEVSVSTSQTITTFGITGNGASVAGSPGTLAAGGFVTFKYNVTVNTWYATNVGNISSFGVIQVSTSINDGSNNEVIKISSTPSAVNELTISNGAGVAGPALSATGSGTNLELSLAGKGTGAVEVRDPTTSLYWPVVTTQSTQTLTNKTLTGPTINTPTISSPTVTGTAAVAAVTLGGNISVDTNDTRKIGTSASNRLLELWSQTVTSQTAKSNTFVGYDTTQDPPVGTVGALTQRNAVVASGRYKTSTGLSTKNYNISTIAPNGTGQYLVNLFDAISTDCAIMVTVPFPVTGAGKFVIVEFCDYITGSQIDLRFSEVDLVANTITPKNANFDIVIVGSPSVDRTL